MVAGLLDTVSWFLFIYWMDVTANDVWKDFKEALQNTTDGLIEPKEGIQSNMHIGTSLLATTVMIVFVIFVAVSLFYVVVVLQLSPV